MDSLYTPCIEHAKQWLSNSNHPIDSDPNVTCMHTSSQCVLVNLIRRCGNYASFQMPVHGSMVPVQVEGLDEQYQQGNSTLTCWIHKCEVIHYLHHEYAKAPLCAVGTSIGANILSELSKFYMT
ncbi:hypothetical protein HYC85_011253 [Camellia sinensis]|uniref:Uncharacterized protein n=1 Tax=Camellia sinensis TaxID=4442 RepID=A0A7J7H8K3_CAMSI|nr:hypothetical protein HYC85_011253 [Camellia sinensis]